MRTQIIIDQTPLSEENYDTFMKVLDEQFRKQHPSVGINYNHSQTQFKEQWLEDDAGNTVQDMIDNEVSHWDQH